MTSEVAVAVSIGAGGTDVGVITGIVECTGFTAPGIVWAGMVIARSTMAALLPTGGNSVSSMSSMIRRAPGSGIFLGLVAVLATSNVLVDELLGEVDGASSSEVECVPVSGTDGASDREVECVPVSGADGASDCAMECVPVSGLVFSPVACSSYKSGHDMGGVAVAPSVATMATEWLWLPRVVTLAFWMSISLASALS